MTTSISGSEMRVAGFAAVNQTLMPGKVHRAAHSRAIKSKVGTEGISAVCWNETSAVEHMLD